MSEPYHCLMAKEWLRYLVGARGATPGAAADPPPPSTR